jgi:hypothetical protein
LATVGLKTDVEPAVALLGVALLGLVGIVVTAFVAAAGELRRTVGCSANTEFAGISCAV